MRARRAQTKKTVRRKPSSFAARLSTAWQSLKLPSFDENVIVAVSGGADSTALLLALDELIKSGKLSITITVAHLDHGLRKGSKEDALWVERLSAELGHTYVKRRSNVKALATKTGDNLEQAARQVRYEFLKRTAKENQAHLILTAHTLDDQAETILLRLLRGSAAEGLGGMEAVRSLDSRSNIQLARPLVSWARRLDTEEYCRARNVQFRVDEMNQNEKFARVKVRKQLLPLMQSFNNKIVEALARTANLLREDAGALTAQAENLIEHAMRPVTGKLDKTDEPSLDVHILAGAPAAVRRRALRQWILRERGDLRRLEMVHLLAVDKLLLGNRGGRVVELPDGARVTRRKGRLTVNGRRPEEKG